MGKVEIGFFSFTEITDPHEHRSYNEWHMLDHMPEQFPLPGVVWGQRWVSTPACRAARLVSEPRLDPIHYLTLYLMAAPVEQTLDEFQALGRHLHEIGRFHEHRRARYSGPLALTAVRVSGRVSISAEAVPYRPNRGVYVVVDALGDAAAPPLPDSHYASALAIPGVAGVWSFATTDGLAHHHRRPDPRRVDVYWLDDDPLAVGATLGPYCVDASRATEARETEFAGAFETITPWSWDWFDEA